MNFSLNSNSIVTVKNLDLVYQIDHYKNQSAKDLFIDLVSSPLNTFSSNERYYHVLKNINFEIKYGDKVGLLGVNGAGKTSLCRCLSGMISPTRGAINISGDTRAIFDTATGIIPELTGRENAELMAALLYPALSTKEQKEIVEEALNFSELGEFIDVPFSKYSKGMQARLNLSLVSARSCDLLLLDEVFDGADIFFQKKISQRVINMMDKSGSVIFVSHSLEQIEMTCNRVIVLNNAEMVFDGNVRDGIKVYKQLDRT